MKNRQLEPLFNGLSAVGDLEGVKFAWAVAKNKEAITQELKHLEESLTPTKEFGEYDKARVELAVSFSKKDEKGNPITKMDGVKSVYDLGDNETEFEKEFKKLRDTHKGALEAREKQISEYGKFLDEESDIKLTMLKFADLPENITSNQVEGISIMIEE